MSSEIVANFGYLFRDVAEKGCSTVGGRVVIESNEVGIGSGICFLSNVTDRTKSISFVTSSVTMSGHVEEGPSMHVLIAKAMPDDER